MTEAKILVVDDEKEIADLIELYLTNEAYEVHKFYNGTDALAWLKEETPDLAVLDVMLPDMSGFTICQKIRENQNFPIIMLTAKDEEIDKITGLTLGADDYVVKPFRPLELVARAKAQLRRYTSYGSRDEVPSSHIISVHGLEINPEAHTVTVDDKPVRCTPIEYSILLYLAENRGRVVPVEDLFRAVWNEEFMQGSNNTVMVHIRHLREKIGDDAQSPRFIKNIWGVGYTIEG